MGDNMTQLLFSNKTETVLAADVLFTDLVMTVANGTGNAFPIPTTGQLLVLTLSSALNAAITEIIHCTNITGDILTIVRAQEGTVARNWYVGDFVANLFTAGTANQFMQINSGTTSQRPIPTIIGEPYYDTTLGYQINCNQITPSIVWHNGQGNPV
jgi:hypothetical protein